jgi:hypothetical protein
MVPFHLQNRRERLHQIEDGHELVQHCERSYRHLNARFDPGGARAVAVASVPRSSTRVEEFGEDLCLPTNYRDVTTRQARDNHKIDCFLLQEGDPCSLYDLNSYCTADGREGPGWEHCANGNITNYADSKGITPLQACCACGGGSAPAAPPPPAPPPPPPSAKCTDNPPDWRSSEGVRNVLLLVSLR